jgi:hypothetical protein
MVPGVISGNILGEATSPSGNNFNDATRGIGVHAKRGAVGHLRRIPRFAECPAINGARENVCVPISASGKSRSSVP